MTAVRYSCAHFKFQRCDKKLHVTETMIRSCPTQGKVEKMQAGELCIQTRLRLSGNVFGKPD